MSYEIDDTSVPPRWLDIRACMLSGQMTAAAVDAEMPATAAQRVEEMA